MLPVQVGDLAPKRMEIVLQLVAFVLVVQEPVGSSSESVQVTSDAGESMETAVVTASLLVLDEKSKELVDVSTPKELCTLTRLTWRAGT
ncbi:hypothetical protein DVH05_010230 [Phytophthora capsici]|nr:hypothetical protein DVH05_010230 [Phytophthora capsici]